jgi:hypothetical protein
MAIEMDPLACLLQFNPKHNNCAGTLCISNSNASNGFITRTLKPFQQRLLEIEESERERKERERKRERERQTEREIKNDI